MGPPLMSVTLSSHSPRGSPYSHRSATIGSTFVAQRKRDRRRHHKPPALQKRPQRVPNIREEIRHKNPHSK